MDRRGLALIGAFLLLVCAFLLIQPAPQVLQTQPDLSGPEAPDIQFPTAEPLDLDWAGRLILVGAKPQVRLSENSVEVRQTHQGQNGPQVPHAPQHQPEPQTPPAPVSPQPDPPGSTTGERHRNQHATDHIPAVPPGAVRRADVSNHDHSVHRRR